jgi:hypothetical protein
MTEQQIHFLYDHVKQNHVVAFRLPFQLMLVLHEAGRATHEVRPWDPLRYQVADRRWKGAELKTKLLEWSDELNKEPQA